MKRDYIFQGLIICGICAALLTQTTDARAGGRSDRWDHHQGFKRHNQGSRLTIELPFGSLSLRVGGKVYHYHRGRFYRRQGFNDYVIVPAPVGAYVDRLPYGHQTVYVNGVFYHIYDGVYYVYSARGYEVVTPPATYYVANTAGVQAAQNAFTVYIPNSKGTFNPVILTKNGSGFIGPQGEYYPEFPNVAQLQVMYGI